MPSPTPHDAPLDLPALRQMAVVAMLRSRTEGVTMPACMLAALLDLVEDALEPPPGDDAVFDAPGPSPSLGEVVGVLLRWRKYSARQIAAFTGAHPDNVASVMRSLGLAVLNGKRSGS